MTYLEKVRAADSPAVQQWLEDIRKGIKRPYPKTDVKIEYSLN